MGCVIRCSNSGVRTNHVSEDSDEKLKQALVLVDLLKIEYAKALRDNHNLRHKGSTLTDDATCASTDEPTPTASSILAQSTNSQQPGSITVDERVPWRRLAGSPQPFQDSPGENGVFPPNKFFRRRIPADYYYDYPIRGFRRRVPFRRENEGDPTTAAATDGVSETETVPNQASTSDAPMDDASETTTDVVSEDVGASAAAIDAVSNDVAPAASTDAASKEVAPTATSHTVTSIVLETKTDRVLLEDEDATIKNTVADISSENSETQKENDPVMSQVAEELIHELNGAEKTHQPKTKPPTTQRSTKMKFNSYLKLAKPTLKIHLGGSTRFPIPLPQNHAFCYTNPRNALCRTSI